jgi:tyrosyl-tRNA synthetase
MDAITNILTRNVDTVIESKHLTTALKSKKKLRIKHGIDPTGDKIHIGRAVVLWKLRELQDLGHKIIIIIGDYTAQIGDPSDKLEKRPFLTPAQIKKNLKNYLPQIGKILDLKKTEIKYNSEWLSKLSFRETCKLADIFTFQQIIERDNFEKRWKNHDPISYREGMYPLMQGYDSVAIKVDVELGGTDQLFNLLAGRKIQEVYRQKPQDIITTKMLIGTDGRKMSTSWGNVINITDKPNDMYGKVMATRDDVMPSYFGLATDLSENEIKKHCGAISKKPKETKELLALEITKRYHGEAKAHKAAEEFTKVFSKKETPTKIPTFTIKQKELPIIEALTRAGIESKNEARRLITQGAVRIGGETKKDPNETLNLASGDILQIGKRRFFKIAKK